MMQTVSTNVYWLFILCVVFCCIVAAVAIWYEIKK